MTTTADPTDRELARRAREDALETMPPPPESLRDWAPAHARRALPAPR